MKNARRLSFALLVFAFTSAAFAAEPVRLKELPSGFRLVQDDIAAGGQPSEADLAALRKAGCRTVFNLRTDGEADVDGADKRAKKAGLAYLRLPITPDTVNDASVTKFREVVNEPANRPIAVYCASSNRVGMMFAILAAVDEGKSIAEAEKIGVAAGLKSEDAKKAFRKYAEAEKAKP